MKIQIIIGSTRPGRISPRVAKWVEQATSQVSGLEAEVVDLQNYDLPFFDEPISPRYNPNRTPSPVAQQWIDKLAEADGYIFVTPEYNHSIPGVLKNAFDFLTFQMTRKPAAIVSYGSVGGARAAEHLKLVLIEGQAIVVPPAVTVLNPEASISEDGELSAELAANPYGPNGALAKTLEDLQWYAQALKTARDAS